MAEILGEVIGRVLIGAIVVGLEIAAHNSPDRDTSHRSGCSCTSCRACAPLDERIPPRVRKLWRRACDFARKNNVGELQKMAARNELNDAQHPEWSLGQACDVHGSPILHFAIVAGALEACDYLLGLRHADPFASNALSFNSLHVACASRQPLLLWRLLQVPGGQSHVSNTNFRKHTPLHVAALSGATECARLLLSVTASAWSARDSQGRRPIDLVPVSNVALGSMFEYFESASRSPDEMVDHFAVEHLDMDVAVTGSEQRGGVTFYLITVSCKLGGGTPWTVAHRNTEFEKLHGDLRDVTRFRPPFPTKGVLEMGRGSASSVVSARMQRFRVFLRTMVQSTTIMRSTVVRAFLGVTDELWNQARDAARQHLSSQHLAGGSGSGSGSSSGNGELGGSANTSLPQSMQSNLVAGAAASRAASTPGGPSAASASLQPDGSNETGAEEAEASEASGGLPKLYEADVGAANAAMASLSVQASAAEGGNDAVRNGHDVGDNNEGNDDNDDDDSETDDSSVPVGAPVQQAEPRDHGGCIVCMERPISTVFVPCGHMAVCLECSTTVLERSRECPVCRQPVDQCVRTFSIT